MCSSDLETELILADIEQLNKKIERLTREAKANAKGAKEALETANALLAHLNDGKSASSFGGKDDDAFINLNKELRLLSAKEVVYGANVGEDGISEDNKYVQALRMLWNSPLNSLARYFSANSGAISMETL